ncbi:hypothetical protein [Asaia bogorensis]|uniref:hypothetical protein n=1 Tax=Asaia bogorensis TaxID=91915 RepID=UPI00286B86EB|nr:hypothetical protein [Asaia bogorensis]
MIVCGAGDPHGSSLENALQTRGYDCASQPFHPSEIADGIIKWDINGGWIFAKDGLKWQLSQIDIIIWRFKPSVWQPPFAFLDDEDLSFRQREWFKFFSSFEAMCPNAFWCNTPMWSEYSGLKINQLLAAYKAGMNVPETIITNDKKEIISKLENGQYIYKTLSHPFHNEKNIILSTKLDKSIIENDLLDFSLSPNLIQKYIEKDYELRVIFCCGEIKTVRILSQKNDRTKVDWRADTYDKSIYSVFEIDAKIKKDIVSLMANLNLEFGILDFIVGKDGVVWFLEVNPSGQWLWIDTLINSKITEFVAESLVSKKIT